MDLKEINLDDIKLPIPEDNRIKTIGNLEWSKSDFAKMWVDSNDVLSTTTLGTTRIKLPIYEMGKAGPVDYVYSTTLSPITFTSTN